MGYFNAWENQTVPKQWKEDFLEFCKKKDLAFIFPDKKITKNPEDEKELLVKMIKENIKNLTVPNKFTLEIYQNTGNAGYFISEPDTFCGSSEIKLKEFIPCMKIYNHNNFFPDWSNKVYEVLDSHKRVDFYQECKEGDYIVRKVCLPPSEPFVYMYVFRFEG